LTYAAIISRPDIAKAISKLAEFQQNPSQAHLDAANYCLKYLHSMKVFDRWGESGTWNLIGTPAQQLRMSMDLGTQNEPKLLFWFSVTVGVKVSPESATIRKKPLYFVLQAVTNRT
jgi:hypothetical protein